ncbi:MULTISPECIES: RNA-guided endonuclease InsQ/TnpB family protein [Nocardiopsis]|uniref:Transposase n=1 Tax=Nocardiopsis sinuspersici TaxID=501010 RepID=A0A1V3C0W2_9ACTN|nr:MULTISPECIES: zinc ribbon domain-containing protein [Nocardiopsis]OOC54119.1 hypothetical protein NOSIN_10135 [Nocardiopsis sinuspersici]
MLTGFRYRLAPTGEQAGLCQVYGDICRAVWNTGLHQRREAVRRWQRGQDLPFCGYHLQARQLAEAKTEEEWLKAAPSHILQQTLRDLDRACRDHGTFNVRWRAKGRWKPSFRFPAGARVIVQRLGRKWGRLKLPKLGWVRFRWSRSAKGTVDAPGTHVRQKAGLNRAILARGWHGFKLACQNAARRSATRIVEVNPAYTSQTCHPCGHVASENRESPSVFRCGACGYRAHADVNAARNTRARGWTSPSG